LIHAKDLHRAYAIATNLAEQTPWVVRDPESPRESVADVGSIREQIFEPRTYVLTSVRLIAREKRQRE
jgi:hypothetical protein